MTFSNTITKDGIIQTYERFTDLGDGYISETEARLREVTAIINRIQHRVWHTIFMSTGNWQYDDGNYTDLPSATTDLVLGQRRYALPTDALTIHKVEVKDSSGNWYQAYPLIKENISHEGIDDFMSDNGTILYYRLVNGVIEVFAPTNYAQADSLKVYFDRDSVDFAYNATTSTPGFASPYHEILPIGASIEWYKVKQPQSPTLGILMQDYARLEVNLKEFYGRRFKDYVPRIVRKKERFK